MGFIICSTLVGKQNFVHAEILLLVYNSERGPVAQSDARPTGIQEVMCSILLSGNILCGDWS